MGTKGHWDLCSRPQGERDKYCPQPGGTDVKSKEPKTTKQDWGRNKYDEDILKKQYLVLYRAA